MVVKKNKKKASKTPSTNMANEDSSSITSSAKIIEAKTEIENENEDKKNEKSIDEVLSSFKVSSVKSDDDKKISELPSHTEKVTSEINIDGDLNIDLKLVRQAVLKELEEINNEQAKVEEKKREEKSLFHRHKNHNNNGTVDVNVKDEGFFSKFKIIVNIVKPLNQLKPVISKFTQGNKSIKALKQENTKSQKPLKKTHHISKGDIIKTIIILIVILFIVFSVGIYLGNWHGKISQSLVKFIPYPAIFVNGKSMPVKTYLEDLNALNKFIARQDIKVDDQQVKKQVLESLVEKMIISQLAENKNIKITQAEINEQLEIISSNNEDENYIADLVYDLYGWNYKQYLEKVIKPLVLASKVENNFYSTTGADKARLEMENYLAEINIDNSKFAEVANQVNEDSTVYVNGDLGWFKLGDMVPEFELPLLDMNDGDISEVVETRFGFHIIKLLEKIIDDNGQVSFHAAHIFKGKALFQDYLDEQIKKATVLTLIRM